MITITQARYKYPKLRVAERKWTMGYMSRTAESQDNALVHIAGGTRKGQLYFEEPSWQSRRYHYRTYLDTSRLTSGEMASLLYAIKYVGGCER